MKENIKKIIILSLVLTIISLLVINIMGKTYSVKIEKTDKLKNGITVENGTGIIEITNQKETNNEYIIKIKAKKSGTAFLRIEYEDFYETKIFYIHNNMVITENNYLGKSTCSEIIPISLTIVLLYLLYLLYKRYSYHKNKNLYQYKNIAYIGIIIFISFFTINNLLSIINYNGLFETINSIINSMSLISFLLFPIALVTSILVTISNVLLIIKEGKSLKNLLGLFLGISICISTLIPEFVYNILMKSQKINIYNLNSIGPYIYSFIETTIYLTITYLECILIGTIIIAIKSIKKKAEYNKDYMIILGCKIKKDGSLTPLLKGRADRALKFRKEQLEQTGKDLIFITSGGKGKDEIISEAEAIKKYLITQGINEKNIIVENKSTNTYENIKYSTKLIKGKANIGFSTTNYHVLRAGIIATNQGILIEGIGSKTKSYFWINAFIREFIGTLYSERKKHFAVFTIIQIVIIIMIGITYISNNI